jgi:uncharacterized protein (TIGR01777 family)
MRVVVAGSSGLLGSALVPALRGAGHEVVRLVRRTPSAEDERAWDPPAGDIGAGALDEADAVVNLCGAGIADRRWTQARKQVLLDSRVTPTEVLATAVAERGIGVLVNGSGIDYYGDTGDVLVDESFPPGHGFLPELCAEWERATVTAQEAGARVVMMRTSPVLSGSGGLLGMIKPIFQFCLGGRLGDGRQYMPWISLDDQIGAIKFAVENERLSGPANFTAPNPVTNTEFTKEMAKAMDRPAPWLVPGFALRLMLGQFADEGILAGQRAVPAALEAAGYEFEHPTLEAALQAALGASTAARG